MALQHRCNNGGMHTAPLKACTQGCTWLCIAAFHSLYASNSAQDTAGTTPKGARMPTAAASCGLLCCLLLPVSSMAELQQSPRLLPLPAVGRAVSAPEGMQQRHCMELHHAVFALHCLLHLIHPALDDLRVLQAAGQAHDKSHVTWQEVLPHVYVVAGRGDDMLAFYNENHCTVTTCQLRHWDLNCNITHSMQMPRWSSCALCPLAACDPGRAPSHSSECAAHSHDSHCPHTMLIASPTFATLGPSL